MQEVRIGCGEGDDKVVFSALTAVIATSGTPTFSTGRETCDDPGNSEKHVARGRDGKAVGFRA